MALSVWLGMTSIAHADAPDEKPKIIAAAGVRALPTVEMWGFIPASPSIAVSADFQRFRIRSDFSLHPLLDGIHFALGFGYVFHPTGENAPTDGGFQLKCPLTGEIGFLFASPEAYDGYNDVLHWFLVGPGAGMDFIWWKAGRAGFVISLKGSWQFKVDMDSQYAEAYSINDGKTGVLDIAILLGVAI
jgi:hypothetical protein